jgi:hypothetical protein
MIVEDESGVVRINYSNNDSDNERRYIRLRSTLNRPAPSHITALNSPTQNDFSFPCYTGFIHPQGLTF